ncbi:MAG: hypothetical protein Q4D16_21890 [Eubacteriales bacterium]|nr:hypothetical protein [Eubacteriales bacterium]
MKKKTIMTIIFFLMIGFVLTFLWSNKDFFRYHYKFKYSQEVNGQIYSVIKNHHAFSTQVSIGYQDKIYNVFLPKALFESYGDTVKVHVIISPLQPDEPIFVRELIIPYFWGYLILGGALTAIRLITSRNRHRIP